MMPPADDTSMDGDMAAPADMPAEAAPEEGAM